MRQEQEEDLLVLSPSPFGKRFIEINKFIFNVFNEEYSIP